MAFSHLLEMIRALFKGLQADFLQVQALNRMLLPRNHLLPMEYVLSNLAVRGIQLRLLILLHLHLHLLVELRGTGHIFSGCALGSGPIILKV